MADVRLNDKAVKAAGGTVVPNWGAQVGDNVFYHPGAGDPGAILFKGVDGKKVRLPKISGGSFEKALTDPKWVAQAQQILGKAGISNFDLNTLPGIAASGSQYTYEKSHFKDKAVGLVKTPLEHLKMIGEGFKSNPLQALFGVDPLGAKIGSAVTGTKMEALTNVFGGPTAGQFAEFQRRGIDTGFSQPLSQVADTIAGIYAGGALGKLAGAGLSNLGVTGQQGGLFGQFGKLLQNPTLQEQVFNFGAGMLTPSASYVGGPGQSALAPSQRPYAGSQGFNPAQSGVGDYNLAPSFSGGGNPFAAPPVGSTVPAGVPNPFESLRERLRTGQGSYTLPNYTPGALATPQPQKMS